MLHAIHTYQPLG